MLLSHDPGIVCFIIINVDKLIPCCDNLFIHYDNSDTTVSLFSLKDNKTDYDAEKSQYINS